MSGLLGRPDGSMLVDAPPAFTAWRALGMLIQLGVTYPKRLAAARDLLAVELDELDRSCSRFRADSELVSVGEAASHAPGPVTLTVSPLLAEAIAVSLRAARLTDGDLDPTVGGALAALGYDRDFAELAQADPRAGAGFRSYTPAVDLATQASAVTQGSPASEASPVTAASPVSVRMIHGWQSVSVDVGARQLTVPPGVRLDLGATVKGWAADRAAARIASRIGCGVLVSLGGDTAVAGQAPHGGWRIRVQDTTGLPEETPDGPSQVVAIRDGGLATSSTSARRWRHGGDLLHHILDPRTGLPAAPVWRTVSVAARTCADANTAATAAIIRGRQALPWLAGLWLPARLVAQDGTIHTVNAWPEDRN